MLKLRRTESEDGSLSGFVSADILLSNAEAKVTEAREQTRQPTVQASLPSCVMIDIDLSDEGHFSTEKRKEAPLSVAEKSCGEQRTFECETFQRRLSNPHDLRGSSPSANDCIEKQMLYELKQLSDEASYRPSLAICLRNFVEDKSAGMDLLLRQVTPGFDDKANSALLQLISKDGDDQDSMVPQTIDHDSSIYAKSIHQINCTPVRRSSNFSRINHEFETATTSKRRACHSQMG